jgi:hypothetical protein
MFQPTSTGDIEPEKFTRCGRSHTNVSLPLHGVSVEVEWGIERKTLPIYRMMCNRDKCFKPEYRSKSIEAKMNSSSQPLLHIKITMYKIPCRMAKLSI